MNNEQKLFDATFNATIPPAGAINAEDRARLYLQHQQTGLDPVTQQPYFVVFDRPGTTLHHDWPDFGDLTARYFEGGILAQIMTGSKAKNQEALQKALLGYFAQDGLNYRPEGEVSIRCAEFFDQGRTMYALCTAVKNDPDNQDLARALHKMVQGLYAVSKPTPLGRYFEGRHYRNGQWVGQFDPVLIDSHYTGPLIRPLLMAAKITADMVARELALGLATHIMEESAVFHADGSYGGHTHSALATACGILDCAYELGRRDWIERIKRVWQFSHRYAGPAGMMPEETPTAHDDEFMMRSETCSIMDYLDLTLLLAKRETNGASFYAAAEKITRNHLIENQCTQTFWGHDSQRIHTALALQDRVAERMLGGFAGWSDMDYFFAMTPEYSGDWPQGSCEQKNFMERPRLFQNCCAAAGLRALYLAWSQALVLQDETLQVNMLFNRKCSYGTAEFADQNGILHIRITADKARPFRIRIPEWCEPKSLKSSLPGRFEDGFYDVEKATELKLEFPIATYTLPYQLPHGGSLDPAYYELDFYGDSVIKVHHVSGGLRALTPEKRKKFSCAAERYLLYQNRQESNCYSSQRPTETHDAIVDWFY